MSVIGMASLASTKHGGDTRVAYVRKGRVKDIVNIDCQI